MPSRELTLRDATDDDAPALAELNAQLGYPTSVEDMRVRLGALTHRSADHRIIVATGEGAAVIGWIHVGRREVLESPPCAEILGLVVDRRARTGGVGRALVAAAEGWARERGVAEVVVRSNIARAESHPFYERVGYRRTKTQHVYRRGVSEG